MVKDDHTRSLTMIFGAALAAALRVTSASAAPPGASDVARLQDEIQRIAAPVGGELGVAAWRLDGRGARVLVRADERFPMASTFKLAVAGGLLAKIDAGTLTLHSMLTVDPKLYVESELIAEAFIHPGVSLSAYNLLELMLTRSDNTATDVLTAAAGGPEAVTAWLRRERSARRLRYRRHFA